MPGLVPLTHLAVIIPARNEECLLPRCLTAATQAVQELREHANRVNVRVVVADRCTDNTTDIAGGWPGVEVITSGHGRVGAARAAGAHHVLTDWDAPPAMWIATTDADSAVPTDWLTTHRWYAHAGADLLLGTVRPDPYELPAPALQTWIRGHDLNDGHPHVYGANMGIRGNIYTRVGGFASLDRDEDVHLAAADRAAGGAVASTGSSPVLTTPSRPRPRPE